MVSDPAERGAPTVSEEGGMHRAAPGRRAGRSAPAIAALAVALPALALYARTLMPDVGFWDTAEFQAVGPLLGIAHPTGYPTYTLLAWLASVVLQPVGSEAVRANLLSALLIAGGAGLVAGTVALYTRRAVAGIAAGAALAVSGETWAVALRADPHALHLALTAALLLMLLVWAGRERRGIGADGWLVGAAALFGISLGNHGLTVLLAPGIGLYVLAVAPGILRRPRMIAACVLALVATTVAIYAYLPLRSAMDPPLDYANPQTWDGFRYLVFAEQFRGTFQALPDPRTMLATIGGETLGQLGLFAVLAVLGVIAAAVRRPQLLLLLGGWFVVNWFFALGYINADIGRYHLVPHLCVAVLGGLGAAFAWDAADRWWAGAAGGRAASIAASIAGRVPAREAAVLVLGALILLAPTLATVPARFDDVDASGDRFAREWLDSLLPQLEANAVVISWWSYSTALWYAQYVEGQRPDVSVIDDSTIFDRGLGNALSVVSNELGRRPVYLIRLVEDLAEYDERFMLAPLHGVDHGVVFRVAGRRPNL